MMTISMAEANFSNVSLNMNKVLDAYHLHLFTGKLTEKK